MSPPQPPFQSDHVAQAFAAFPAGIRDSLLDLRALIFAVAGATDGVGRIEETLKWGQPAYLTPETRSGSTIRLGVPRQGGFAVYAHCQTTIVSDFRSIFPDDFAYEANRAVLFADGDSIPQDKISLLIAAALTYHLRK